MCHDERPFSIINYLVTVYLKNVILTKTGRCTPPPPGLVCVAGQMF